VLATLTVALALVSGPAAAQDQQPRTSLPDIEDEVMCVECGTALNLSEAAVADEMREYIEREIAEGRTKEEIKASLAAQFGDAVLAEPPSAGIGAAVYIVPPLAALLALAGIVVASRRWRAAGPAPSKPAKAPLDEADAKRLDSDMAAYDL
jgi:cytochrome c-type biogenesis protein CcmH